MPHYSYLWRMCSFHYRVQDFILQAECPLMPCIQYRVRYITMMWVFWILTVSKFYNKKCGAATQILASDKALQIIHSLPSVSRRFSGTNYFHLAVIHLAMLRVFLRYNLPLFFPRVQITMIFGSNAIISVSKSFLTLQPFFSFWVSYYMSWMIRYFQTILL